MDKYVTRMNEKKNGRQSARLRQANRMRFGRGDRATAPDWRFWWIPVLSGERTEAEKERKVDEEIAEKYSKGD